MLLQTEATTKPSGLATKNLKALVFDDDPAMRSLLTEVLEQEGITCNTFEKFSEFKVISGATDYDFVLTDIQMPETDGFQVLKQLKSEAFSCFTNQPVIAMTGNQQHKSDFYFEKGFTELLHKPFHKVELFNVLHRLFDTGQEVSDTTATPTQETESLYNLSMLKSFMKDEKGLKEILSVFLIQTKKDMLELREAVAHNDLDTIRALSHRKLTMARQIQAKKVVTVLETLELIPDDPENLHVLFSRLEDEIDQMTAALEAEIF